MRLDRNLVLRVASAAVGLPILGALVFWREPWGFAVFTLLAAAVALTEYAGLALKQRSASERAAVVLVGLGLLLGLYVRLDLALAWVMLAVIALGAVALTHADDIPGAIARLGASMFGVTYVSGLIVALPLLHRTPQGSLWVVVALAVTFAADTGAYFVGRTLGRHKLAPSISPGKTVEGGFGGLAAALGFMFIARATFFPALTVLDCILCGLAAGVLGPVGDLLESLLKRSAGVKDSGKLIPGHGGMLDRIDAVLFVGAYVYWHVLIIRP